MANTREIRSRIKSIQDIMKITNAMYLISSSKLKKARKSLAATKPYFEALQATIYDILVRAPHVHNVFFQRRDEIAPSDRKKGFLVITADKGLAGAYNHNVIKKAEEEMKKSNNNYLFVVGQVGRQYFNRKSVKLDGEFLYTAQNPTLYRAENISKTIIDLFEQKELDDVYVIYTKMITPMKAEVQFGKLLPLERKKFERRAAGYQHAKFDPSSEIVMDRLVPNYLKGLIFGVLVESFSSEQNARMTAMEAATKSAKDMLKRLELQYNRARQAAITQEITEIVSGAKSLKK
ncbi:MAG: ATP synthase F1 subunit gamma [Herbinix sp.]|nr:ATP synthase F1 subunit gamma [Herbinix sp.]